MLSHDSTPIAKGLVPGLLQRLDVDIEIPDLLSDAAHGRRRHVFCYLFWKTEKENEFITGYLDNLFLNFFSLLVCFLR